MSKTYSGVPASRAPAKPNRHRQKGRVDGTGPQPTVAPRRPPMGEVGARGVMPKTPPSASEHLAFMAATQQRNMAVLAQAIQALWPVSVKAEAEQREYLRLETAPTALESVALDLWDATPLPLPRPKPDPSGPMRYANEIFGLATVCAVVGIAAGLRALTDGVTSGLLAVCVMATLVTGACCVRYAETLGDITAARQAWIRSCGYDAAVAAEIGAHLAGVALAAALPGAYRVTDAPLSILKWCAYYPAASINARGYLDPGTRRTERAARYGFITALVGEDA